MYYAPVYFVYLLRGYCWRAADGRAQFQPARLLELGAVVAAVFTASLGPLVRAANRTQSCPHCPMLLSCCWHGPL
jgi:hypothetical protein